MLLSAVVLIPKEGNDYHGIGLREVAWKILEGVLDGRMKGIELHDTPSTASSWIYAKCTRSWTEDAASKSWMTAG